MGLALSLLGLTAIIAALLFHQLKNHLSFQGMVRLIFILFAICYFVIATTSFYWVIIISLLIGGFGIGILPPNFNIWITSLSSPAMRGRAIGGLTAALFLGQFFTPILTQPLIEQQGISGTFWIIGAVLLLLATTFAVIVFRKHNSSMS